MPLASASSVQVPEKSGFAWANARDVTAKTAAAMIPTRARFMCCSFDG
jgi:hypothetical protein